MRNVIDIAFQVAIYGNDARIVYVHIGVVYAFEYHVALSLNFIFI